MWGGRGPVYINGDVNIDRSNNIYNNRNGVNTNDIGRPSQQPGNGSVNRPSNLPANNGNRLSSNRAGNRPPTQPADNMARNNAVTDKQYNVYHVTSRVTGNKEMTIPGSRRIMPPPTT